MINFTRGRCQSWHRFQNKMLLLAAFLFLFIGNGFSQNIISAKLSEMKTSGPTENVQLLSTASGNFHQAEYELIIKDEEYLQIDSEVSESLINEKPDLLRFSVPFENQIIELDLYRSEVLADGYELNTSDGLTSGMRDDYVLYKGTILNRPNTVATISIFKEGTIIQIADDNGNIRIVPFEQDIYTVYRDSKFVEDKPFDCGTSADFEVNISKQIDQGFAAKSQLGNCIEVYFVADFALYQQNGSSVLNTENWIIANVNEVQTLYANEGIPMDISAIFVHTSSDPYALINDIGDVLTEFGVQTQNAYSGRLAHLLSSRGLGGGIAWIDVLCSNYVDTGTQQYGPYAVSSGLSTATTPFPTYSWNVMVIAHEMGHNVGSPHTHDCVWNGNGTQVDDCGNVAGFSTGTCYNSGSPIIPASGGTIMSYCHLNTVGINFNNGFGTEPGNLIFNKFTGASCVTGNCVLDDCMDPWACNYNPSATVGGDCNYNFGCTDTAACNYYFAADCDDGTCVYDSNSCTSACIDGSGNGVDFRSDFWPFLWTTDVGTGDGTVSHNNATMHIVGNNAGGSNVLTQRTILANTTGTFSFDWCYYTTDGPLYDIAYYINGVQVDLTDTSLGDIQNGSGSFFANTGDLIGFGIQSTDGGFGAGELTIKNFKWPVDEAGCGCMDPWACNYDSAATLHDTELCSYAFGCTDNAACNFDFSAVCDDGTCAYETNSCTSQCVDTSGNGVGFRGDYWPFFWNQATGGGDGTISHGNSALHIVGNNSGGSNVLTQVSMLATATGTFTFDWCYFTQDGPVYDIAYYINGVQVDLTDTSLGDIQNGSGSFFAFAGDLIGFGIQSTDGVAGAGELTIKNYHWPVDEAGCGCMDPWACNYQTFATQHDTEACSYAFGCTDNNACNYSFTAICDNGSCVYNENTCTDACQDGSGNGVDFRSDYWPFLWTQDTGTGDGTIQHNNGALHIVGNNEGGSNVLTQVSMLANQTGTFTFDWCYFTQDGPFYDIAYYINGVQVDLTDTSLGDIQNGSASFFANAGDLIGFGIQSTDGVAGAGELTITNFTWPINETGCGCMDPWACNYDSTATNHDTVACTYDFGCTDPTACNYDFGANCDDGSCAFDIHECLNYCVDDFNNGVGFMNNYWPFLWTQDVGTGDGTIVQSNSTLHIVGNDDGGSNVLTQVSMLAAATGTFAFDWCYFTQDGPSYDIAYYINGIQVDLTDTSLGDIQNGSDSFFANAGDLIGFGIQSTDGAVGAGELTINNFTWPLDTSTCGCADPLACNYDPFIFNHDPLACTYGGCTDTAACNYDFNVGCDDGSCEYDEDACFEYCYDPTTGNGVGFRHDYWPFLWTQDFDGGEGAINHSNGYVQIIGNNNTAINGSTTQTTILATATGDFSFNWNYFTTDGASFDPAVYINGVETQLSVNADGNSQSGSVTFTANAGDLIGFGVTSTDGCCGEATLVVSDFTWPMDTSACGCTDPWACNYDSAATNYEDGSCDYNLGCMDTTACNYDFGASCDDGSCEYDVNECFGYCVDASGDGVGFINQYWSFLWTQDLGTGNGSISHTESAIHIIGNDDTNENGVLTQTSYTAQTTGDYSFDWCYFGTDGPAFDIAYYINGVEIDITDSSMGNLQNGSITFTANAGDVIGWGINSTDGCCGEGHLTINNFTWPIDYTPCGCMDPWASNFDSTATIQDHDQCEYLHGCTDATACNYDATAVSDTGSCVYDSSDCTADCIDAFGNGYDFNAYYAPGNWTYNYGTGNGEITQTIGSMHILGNNNSGSLDSNVLTEATIVADQTGVYTFDWCYYTTDGPQFDIAYFVNGVRVDLTDTSLGDTQNGSVSFFANAGDVIAFGIDSTDGCCGYGLLTIANFTYPSQECCCPGDANNDFVVNVLDLIAVSSNFGCTVGCGPGDADCDGAVSILDLVSVSSNFGAVCP